MRRIILVRPPGSKGKEIALSLTEYLSENEQLECISTGDLVDKEISKRSAFGKEIEQSRQTHSFVKDEIVIQLVKSQIEQLEKAQKSYVLEGFPRTEVQAISLLKMGIIPDKFILLEQNDTFSMDRIRSNLASDDCPVAQRRHQENQNSTELQRIASAAIRENNINMAAVKKVCQGLITELDGTKEQPLILEEIARVLKLKYSKGARRPQRVILMGPPGSSTSEQAKRVCEKYNLVHVQVLQVLKDVIRKQADSNEARRLV